MEQTLESMKGRMDKIEQATSMGLSNILSEMFTMKNTFQELMLEMRDDTIKLAGPPAKMAQWVEEMAKKMEDSQASQTRMGRRHWN
jgi:predicted N-formylglutamate amidohydrolase